MSVEHFTFDSKNPGTKVLIFGAIHGDEHCGPVAIQEVTTDIQRGKIELATGSVTFVPICNPEAYKTHRRVIKENLNRIFHKTEKPTNKEAVLANELCLLVDTHDALLDIHSSFVPAPSNVFVDYPTQENMSFAKALAPEYLIFGWPEVYAHSAHRFDSWTTDRYAYEAGKIGVLAECGKHDDPNALVLARRYILNTLAHFGVVTRDARAVGTTDPVSVRMTEIFKRESADDSFTNPWYHLQPIPMGTHIATRASGEQISVDTDCYILFPKEYALPGGEWFYLAVKKSD